MANVLNQSDIPAESPTSANWGWLPDFIENPLRGSVRAVNETVYEAIDGATSIVQRIADAAPAALDSAFNMVGDSLRRTTDFVTEDVIGNAIGDLSLSIVLPVVLVLGALVVLLWALQRFTTFDAGAFAARMV